MEEKKIYFNMYFPANIYELNYIFSENITCSNRPCKHGVCYDTPAGFRCDCDQGFSDIDCSAGKYFQLWIELDFVIVD